jgi:acetyl esterase
MTVAWDEAMKALLAGTDEACGCPLPECTPARGLRQVTAEVVGGAPPMHAVAEIELGQPVASFTVRILTPVAEPDGVIVHLHGRRAASDHLGDLDASARRIAERTRCAVVLVDHRSAPEHPYPAAVDDAWVAMTWAARHLAEPRDLSLVLAGETGADDLCVALALDARDEGWPRIALQILVDPPAEAEPVGPDLGPLPPFALDGLPPALIVRTGTDAASRSEDARGVALAAAGVEVEIVACSDVVAGRDDGSRTGAHPGRETTLDLVAAKIRGRLRVAVTH